jgi:hypothetical protein
MHTRLANFPKRLGQHARTFAHGAGTALDKTMGLAHHYLKDADPAVAGAIGGAMGHDAAAITQTVGRAKRNLASYEQLRNTFVGKR